MKLAARLADITAVADTVDHGPASTWGGRCHEISLALLRTGLVGEGRVARGFAEKVGGQHSWIVLGRDCYDRGATVVDPTIFSYWKRDPFIWIGPNRLHHVPHGTGSIWHYPPPLTAEQAGEPAIALTGADDLSQEAKRFLQRCGPLGLRGWAQLVHNPVGGWPAGEIISAVCETPQLKALVPIDIVGMVTDINPSNAYW